mgnify:CR=1 FL=1
MFDDKFVWGVASSAYFKIRMRTQAVIICIIIKMTMH